MGTDGDRAKAVDLAISQIERQFGKGSIMRLGAKEQIEDIAVIPTGSLSLDIALGIGGVPRGRIIEIFGPESGGKTTLALHIIAEAQKQNGLAAFIDAEHALDVSYARKIGVNTDDLLISQPDTGEQALEIAETLVRSGAMDILVVDSVAALVPKAEIEGEMGGRPDGSPGPADVPGPAETHRQHQQVQDDRHLHQSVANEDRRIFRESGNDDGRQRPEVLFIHASRHPQVRLDQAGAGRRRHADQGQGRQKQGGAALPGDGIRYHLRRREFPRPAISSTLPRKAESWKRAAPGIPTKETGSVRAETIPGPF